MDTKKFLSIRAKLIAVILVIATIFSIVIYFISITFLLNSYEKIERDQFLQNLERTKDAIDNSVDQLDIKISDWAWWDDTYDFVIDSNTAYMESNLVNESLANLKINSMVFINNNGGIIFKKMIDFNTKATLSTDNIEKHIIEHNILTKGLGLGSKIKGLIMLPEGPMLLVAAPILTSSGQGPPHGTLIFGKVFDNQFVESLGGLTHLKINAYNYNSTSLPIDVLLAKNEIQNKENTTTFINPISKSEIAGYLTIKDIYNNPVLILKIDSPRDIYNQGLRTLYLFIAIAIMVTLFFGIIISIIFEKIFISRISKMNKEIGNIDETKDFSVRVTEDSKDEIGLLSTSINHMLSTLSSPQPPIDTGTKMVELDRESEDLKKKS